MNIERIRNLVRAFYPFAKQKLGFDKPVKVKYIVDDMENFENPLGKTAYYSPEQKVVTLFTLNRHPKDILRSFAHELTHHAQHCRGEFDGNMELNDGYAQEDPHMRKMEEEAYLNGGMLVRDWTDSLQKNNQKALIMIVENKENEEHKEVKQIRKRLNDEEAVTDMFEERRNRLNKKLIDKFIKPIKKEGNTE